MEAPEPVACTGGPSISGYEYQGDFLKVPNPQHLA